MRATLARSATAVLVAISTIPAAAAEVTFIGTGAAQWGEPSNWAGGALPGAGDVAVFSQTSGDLQVNLVDLHTVGGLRITNTGATTIQRGGISGTIAINIGAQGIVVEPGAGPVIIGPDIGNPANQRVKPVLTASQSWINNSANLLLKDAGGGAMEMPGIVLTFGGSGDIQINSAIVDDVPSGSPSGSMVKDGSGTLFLTRANPRISGGFTLNAGVVSVEHDQALAGIDGTGPVTINGGMLVSNSNDRSLPNAFTVAGDFAVGGSFDLTFSGVPVTLAASPAITVSGSKTVLAGEVETTQPVFFSLAGGITDDGAGHGIVKRGDAVLLVNGAGTYTGPTRVEEGILVINGDLSAAPGNVTVLAGAVLAGTGTIGGNLIAEGQVVAAGTLPGTLSVNGSVTMAPGSSATFEHAISTGDPGIDLLSQLKVNGEFTIGTGMRIEVNASAYTGGPSSLLLVDAGSISGDPSGVNLDLDLPEGLSGQLRVAGAQLFLDILDAVASFWAAYPDNGGFKLTEVAGWLYDPMFPWVYSVQQAAWIYVLPQGGSADAFHAWSSVEQGWLHLDVQYQGWYWSYRDTNWKR